MAGQLGVLMRCLMSAYIARFAVFGLPRTDKTIPKQLPNVK